MHMAKGNSTNTIKQENVSVKERELLRFVEEFDLIEIQSYDYSILTKNILKKLQETKSKLVIYGEDYTVALEGKDITNYENQLSTDLHFIKENDGFTFVLNEGKNLPGKLALHISDNLPGKYLYLYNISKARYKFLNDNRFEKIIHQGGKYYYVNKKIHKCNLYKIIALFICLIFLGLIAIVQIF